VAAHSIEGRYVAIGPVQLIVLGFSHPEFHGEIVAELERLRESDTVRVIDALAVHKDAEGEIEEGAAAGAKAAADGIQAFSDEQAWDVLGEIPDDSAAALILLEHHWAVPLRNAIAAAGGFRISDGFISPVDLVEIGLLSAEEAKEHHLQPAPVPVGT